ncbi:unnamed protein product [Caenorhabditis brenneri]
MQASIIVFSCRTAFSDDQLLKLKAKSMDFDDEDFTDERINKFIRNWAYGKAVDGFERVHFWNVVDRDPDVLLEGLDEVKEWDEEFEKEQREFAEGFKGLEDGRFYQIGSKVRPFESLTLVIDEELIGRVSIYATGERQEINGQASTYYRIPKSDSE